MILRKLFISCLLAGLLLPTIESFGALRNLSHFQKKAQSFNAVLKVPDFDQTPDKIDATLDQGLAIGDKEGDAIAELKEDEASFSNTIAALDDLGYRVDSAISPIWILENAAPDAAIRKAATEALKKYEEWEVAFDFRADVYQSIRNYTKTSPQLTGEKAKLLKETLLDYKRNGFELSKEKRTELERLQKELAKLSKDFDTNIADAVAPLTFTAAELTGVPASFLGQEGIKTGDDEYTIMANITWHFLAIMRNASNEETRKKVKFARYTLAGENNVELLKQILNIRSDIASNLGYSSWGDYRTEVKMANNASTVLSFLNKLNSGLKPKFEAELAAFQALKASDTGDPKAKINIWDWRYYRNKLMKDKYQVDTEALRVFFPYDATLKGMFDLYQEVFGLKIEEIENPYRWHEDVTLHVVSDSESGEPMGLFYLDMYPRPGKYNHFAQFPIIGSRQLPNGQKLRPTVALICNFPPPQGDEPSLLSLDEVETLFHEFGHVLHSMMSQVEFYRFSGTSVPRDFVEAPSQMLEYWLESKEVLDRFAADYRDPSKKISRDTLTRITEAKKATVATTYSRQLLLGLMDMSYHSPLVASEDFDLLKESDRLFKNTFLPAPENTAFPAFFGHLVGYDAGYYGYAWSDVIAADMANVFEKATDGYLDHKTGRRLRKEIYSSGDSRDVSQSIEAFLGRERSMEPFLKKLGIN